MSSDSESLQSQFIAVCPLGRAGEIAEAKVFDAVRVAFAGRECLGFWCYPIFSPHRPIRYEPDILIADRQWGLIVIEVKSIRIEEIVEIAGHQWQMLPSFYKPEIEPYRQAENQLQDFWGYCDRHLQLRQMPGRVLVALPWISRDQWQARGFGDRPCCPPVLLQDQLTPKRLLRQVERQATILRSGPPLDPEAWSQLLTLLGGSRPPQVETTIVLLSPAPRPTSAFTATPPPQPT